MTVGLSREFSRAFPWTSAAVCVAAVTLHAWGMRELTGSGTQPAEQFRLLELGAKSGGLVAETGESWRLLTMHLVHTGWVHLAFNLGLFFPVSGAIELVVTRVSHVALLLTCAAVAGVASLLWTPEVSAGASGLVFGMLAAAVVLGLRHHRSLPRKIRTHFGLWVLPFLVIVLLATWNNAYVDHASHLGGMAAGLAWGPWLQLRTRSRVGTLVASRAWTRVESIRMFTGVASCVLALAIAPSLARKFRAPVRHRVASHWELTMPQAWEPRYGPTGTLQFRGGNGFVFVDIDRVEGPDATSWEAAYRRRGLDPLATAGLLTSVGVDARGWLRDTPEPIAFVRYHYHREDRTVLRETYFAADPSLPGEALVLSIEAPLAWYDKYGETRAALVGSIRPVAPARSEPDALVTQSASAAAIR